MNKYERELSALKPYDEVQFTEQLTGKAQEFQFITTAGHGYLVVPKDNTMADIAKRICKYGFVGELAYYLEEDSEASEFIKVLN